MVGTVSPPGRTIHVSVHDASPARWEVLREMDSTLRERGAFPYSLLVIPDLEGGASLDAHPDFCAWLRELQASGVEMVLHGLTHSGGEDCSGFMNTLRRALFTRGEGEFLCLSEEESARRIDAGRRLLETALGGSVRAFAAPAWLYSPGAVRALARAGFIYAESRWREWNPSSGHASLRVPVLNFAGGSPLKRFAASAWVSAGRLLLSRARTLRLALHPSDFEDPGRREAAMSLLSVSLRSRKAVCPALPAGGNRHEGFCL
jgi:predicted deacetylase